MSHILEDFKAFLEASPTSWHAAREMGNRFAMRDFTPLNENEKWHLEPGKKYFIVRGGSVCAFSLPKERVQKAVILASHTDSPALKLKPLPTFRVENMTLFRVEPYGAPLLSSWLNRDLAIAGRVVTEGNGYVEERLVYLDDAICFIPQLPIHLDRDVNEKGLILNKHEHLCPIVGLSGLREQSGDDQVNAVEKILRRHLSFHTLLSFELFLVPCEPPRFVGLNNEMISSYRLDNLSSAHAALSALAVSEPAENTVQMAVFWDNEEIGSRTKDGAASPFLEEVLRRIHHSFESDLEDFFVLKHNSFCVSLDVAHAFNPNYPKKYDPQHMALLGKGIAIKQNADQKYASTAFAAAVIMRACHMLKLPYQSSVNRSDIPSGSTVGPIVAAETGITTIDIGCPQLSMHSTREVMACEDYLDMYRLLVYLLQEA
jgi:aspartyl aminopeptidase